MISPSQAGALLHPDQFGGGGQQQGDGHTEQITYQYPLSRYHTGHPVDQALGLKDIASNITAGLKAEKPGPGAILDGTAALQKGGM